MAEEREPGLHVSRLRMDAISAACEYFTLDQTGRNTRAVLRVADMMEPWLEANPEARTMLNELYTARRDVGFGRDMITPEIRKVLATSPFGRILGGNFEKREKIVEPDSREEVVEVVVGLEMVDSQNDH